ncbi:EVE domain-containing protein [Chloroflexota bacterium]
MPNYFMVVQTHYNWSLTKERNFTFIGFKDGQSRNIIRSIEIGDLLIYYVSSGISSLGAIVEVTSPLYKDSDLYWDDFYNLRFKTKPIVILQEEQFVPFRPLVERLNFVKNKRRWANYVYHCIRILNESDFKLMQSAILQAKK